MGRASVISGLLLVSAIAVDAQQLAAGQKETVDPRLLEKVLRVPGATTRAHAAVIDPNSQRRRAEEGVMVDLGAVRARAGGAGEIRVVRENQNVEAPAGQDEVALRRGDVLAVRRPEGAQPTVSPEGVTVTTSQTILYALDSSQRARELGLVHRTAGLHWQSERARFTGELLVGLMDRENPQATGPLGVKIPVQLLAAPKSINPEALELDSIGDFKAVNIDIEYPDSPFRVQLISRIDLDLPPADLQVFRPQLQLTTASTIQGLGVQESDVTVTGVNTSLPPGQTLTLDLENGWLADRNVTVRQDGTASTRLRSNWLGQGTLRVVAPSMYQADPRTIQFTIPVRFIGATLFGGMLGGFIFVYMLKGKESRRKRSHTWDWIAGVIIGFGVTTMAYAGMKLPEFIPMPAALTGEVAPFALSFICAAAGTTLINAIVGQTKSS
ncbi:MAG TPA: hypothetical protein VFR18_01430 [Terriglobia bacterium]|nr:hypothetical protein [Terriglobia bacterium]